MTRDDCKKYALEMFMDVNKELLGRSEFSVHLTENDHKMMEKWLDYLENTYGIKTIGMMFLANWIESCFNYWYGNVKMKGVSKIIYLNWIFGKKSIVRYEKVKDKDFALNSFKFRGLKREGGIAIMSKYTKIEANKILKAQYLGVNKMEEFQKALHYNTVEGYVWCAANTSMYNHQSEHCMLCVSKDKCKSNLRVNYPNIYQLRGYGRTTE